MRELTVRKRGGVLPVLVVALFAGACTSGATATPATTPAATTPTTAAPGTAAPATPVALPPAETTTLAMGFANLVAIEDFPLSLAKQAGIHQKYGLNTTVTPLEGGTAVTSALLAGQLQIGTTDAQAVIASQLTDQPLVMVTVNAKTLPYALVGGKDIKSAADLKGKGVGVSGLGGVSHGAVLAALERMGVAESEVTVQIIGGESSRIAALVAGTVAAAPVSVFNTQKLIDQGLNILLDLTANPVPFVVDGVTVTKDWAAKNPNTLLRVIASQLEAQKIMFTDEARALAEYRALTNLDEATAKTSLEHYAESVGNKGFRFTAQDFALNKQMIAKINTATANVDLATVIDISYLDKLQSMGFNAELQFP